MGKKESAEETIKTIRRQYSAEEKIRIVIAGMRGEETVAELCRREGTLLLLEQRVHGSGQVTSGGRY